jgi:peptidyl-tRNA hydrolase
MAAPQAFQDTRELADARASQEDPLVMYLVVRESRTLSYNELLGAAAKAAIACDEAFASNPRCAAAFSDWYSQSYRKVTLRADEKEWAQLLKGKHAAAVVDGEDAVVALPPLRKSERKPLLKRLQVYTLTPGELPEKKVRVKPGFPNMLVVLNGTVPMSAGKAAAQVAHAALAALHNGGSDELSLKLWRRDGCKVEIALAGSVQWLALRNLPGVSLITDRGLTEVEPGSETVLALPPMLRPLEPELLRSLARL